MALLSDNDGLLRPLKKAAFPNKNATTQRDNKVPQISHEFSVDVRHPSQSSNSRCWRMDKRRICDGSEELRALKERLHMAKVNKERRLFTSWVMFGCCKLVFQLCAVQSIFQIDLIGGLLYLVVEDF